MSLTKKQIEKYASVLIWGLETARTKPFKQYDNIMVRFEPEAISLAEELQKQLLERRMHVILRGLPTPTLEKNFYSIADEKQLKKIHAGEEALYSTLNGNIFLGAPSSLTHLKDVDPKKIAQVAKTRKKIRNILEKREESGQFSWTLCMLPTLELAKQAKLSLPEYSKQIINACFLNTSDPIKKWQEIFQDSLAIKKWLNSLPIKSISVESKNMDLEVLLGEKRKFIGISGHNIPSFELFTSPDWRGTRGSYYANQPSFRNGNLVKGVRLEFEKGKVIKSDASKGASFVEQMIAMDKGASRIGEFSLTDKRFSRINQFMANTLFDENFGGDQGNCHIALGNSYTDTFNGNLKTMTAQRKRELGFNESALHWDLVNTEKKLVTANLKNGKTTVIYENGKFNY